MILDAVAPWLVGITIAAWIGFAWALVHAARSVARLEDVAPGRAAGGRSQELAQALPSVGVVIAARNEAQHLPETLATFAAVQGVELRVVVVDDRSTDATAQIADEFAARDARFQRLTIDTLPPGWLGKCYACHCGAAQLDTSWILFADGDTHVSPTALEQALEAAELTGADHVVLTPRQEPATWFARLLVQSFFAIGKLAAARANRGRGPIGVGAFNLVRREAYLQVGGYEALRLEIIDDLKLGERLLDDGFVSRAFDGQLQLTVDWAATFGRFLKATEKNAFALFGFSRLRMGLATLFGALVFGVTFVLPWRLGPLWGWTSLASFWLSGVGYALSGHTWLERASLLIFAPLTWLALFVTALNSAVKTLGQRGVRWRGTTYALKDLKQK